MTDALNDQGFIDPWTKSLCLLLPVKMPTVQNFLQVCEKGSFTLTVFYWVVMYSVEWVALGLVTSDWH